MSEQPIQVQLKLWPIAWPIFIELFLVFTVFFADTFFLSQISSEVAGAVGMLFPIFGICAMIILMMESAATSVAAQFIGGRRFEKVVPTYMTIMFLNTAIGAILSVIIWFTSDKLGLWMGLSPELNEQVSVYLAIVSPIWFIFGHRSTYGTVFMSRGLSFWNMRLAILFNISNIGLNALFLFEVGGLPNLGIVGIGIATLLSSALTSVFAVYVGHVKLELRFVWDGIFEKSKELIRPILRIGIPSTMEPAAYQFVQVMINLMVIEMGEVAINTRTFTFNVLILGVSWSAAIAIATQIIVAHNVGAKDFDQANTRFNKSISLGLFAGLGIGLLTIVLAKPLFSIFTDNEAVHQLGFSLLLFGIILEPVRSINIISANALKGAGDNKFSSYVSTGILLGFAIPASYALGVHWSYGLIGVWIAALLDECLRMTVNYSRWKTGKWVHMGVLADQPNEAEKVSAA